MSLLVLLWAAYAVAAVADWWAIAAGRRAVEVIAKPAAMVALIGVVLASDLTGATRTWLLVALALCLVGDVMLLGDSEPAFRGGLAAFLLGHLAYAVLFLHLGVAVSWWLAGAVLTLALLLPVGGRSRSW